MFCREYHSTMPGITAQACLASVSAEQYVHNHFTSIYRTPRHMKSTLHQCFPQGLTYGARARARAVSTSGIWQTHFCLEMRNLCLFATDQKSPPKKPRVKGKNDRINFSSLVWDKGFALSGITSESLKVHSCSPMSL